MPPRTPCQHLRELIQLQQPRLLGLNIVLVERQKPTQVKAATKHNHSLLRLLLLLLLRQATHTASRAAAGGENSRVVSFCCCRSTVAVSRCARNSRSLEGTLLFISGSRLCCAAGLAAPPAAASAARYCCCWVCCRHRHYASSGSWTVAAAGEWGGSKQNDVKSGLLPLCTSERKCSLCPHTCCGVVWCARPPFPHPHTKSKAPPVAMACPKRGVGEPLILTCVQRSVSVGPNPASSHTSSRGPLSASPPNNTTWLPTYMGGSSSSTHTCTQTYGSAGKQAC